MLAGAREGKRISQCKHDSKRRNAAAGEADVRRYMYQRGENERR
jgi:hypothetical protein